jgi:glycosyltransferase involved in cell wall biosynthesis
MPEISIIIPFFNRAWCLSRSLNSAYKFLENIGGGEIVLIDDGSTDESDIVIQKFFDTHFNYNINHKFIKQKNKGVCSAKNTGALLASNAWIIFLDSDDELIPESAQKVIFYLNSPNQSVLNFFSCIDEENNLIGKKSSTLLKRTFNDFILKGTDGESLPIIRRDVFISYLYDEDIKGFESLSYIRIVKNFGFAVINPIIVRKYYTSHDDRLSSYVGIRLRSFSLVKGYFRLYFENFSELNFKSNIYIFIRIIFHSIRGFIYWFRNFLA